MERGSSKHGPMMDDQLADENQPLERAAKEGRADEVREGERVGREDAFADEERRGTDRDRHLAGSQSNAEVHPHQEFEAGGSGHPKPKEGAPDGEEERKDKGVEDVVDEASADSFPASDPPAW